jgi:predicted DNA-binding transcriptional regulator AlpA
MQEQQAYLPSAAVRARYGVSDMSLWRWLRNEATGFPHPIRVGKRRFWKLDELEAWEASRAKPKPKEATHAGAAQC